MRKNTLPRLADSTWAHPYALSPWSPIVYADGGDGGAGDGGAGTGSGGSEPGAGDGGEPKGDGLGEGGVKALKAERDARKVAEDRVKELEAEANRLRRSNASQKGTDLEALREEMRGEFAVSIAETGLKAEAKGRLVKPADVLLYLKADDFKGTDEAAITKAVDDLLKDRPYLAVTKDDDGKGGKWGDVGGGNRGTSEPEPVSPVDRMRRAYAANK